MNVGGSAPDIRGTAESVCIHASQNGLHISEATSQRWPRSCRSSGPNSANSRRERARRRHSPTTVRKIRMFAVHMAFSFASMKSQHQFRFSPRTCCDADHRLSFSNSAR
jgi:hypothetical protein